MTGDMVTVTLTREQWQRVTLALGDAVRELAPADRIPCQWCGA